MPARLYDWNLGWLLGNRFLRLTHIGRTSDWYRNIGARPAVEVAVGRWEYDGSADARARLAHGLPLVAFRPRRG